ncbi:MAG: FMN-binding protein [Bacillota bacterium]|nr:FMN-binding protein [Bacillota bacterium]
MKRNLALLMVLVLSLVALTACGGEKAPAEGGAPAEATTLTGTAEGFKGPITVEVTKEGDVITKVEVKEHSDSVDEVPAVTEALESIPAAIVEAGNADNIEAVSGATFTSEGIINAVKNAE